MSVMVTNLIFLQIKPFSINGWHNKEFDLGLDCVVVCLGRFKNVRGVFDKTLKVMGLYCSLIENTWDIGIKSISVL